MAIKMKALRTFGFAGANEGSIRRGLEFEVKDLNRAKDLEAHGLAYRIDDPRPTPPTDVPKNENLKNEAAESGPFASAGGGTGDLLPADPVQEVPVPSSPPVRPPRRRRSKQ